MTRLLSAGLFLLVLGSTVAWPSGQQARADDEDDYRTGTQAFTRGDFRSANTYWEMAARNEHPGAMTALGQMFERGEGEIRQDYNRAYIYYQKAADKGYAPAQYRLAILNYLPKDAGGKGDPVTAYMWAELASSDPGRVGTDATALRDTLRGELKPEQQAEGLKQARAWQKAKEERDKPKPKPPEPPAPTAATPNSAPPPTNNANAPIPLAPQATTAPVAPQPQQYAPYPQQMPQQYAPYPQQMPQQYAPYPQQMPQQMPQQYAPYPQQMPQQYAPYPQQMPQQYPPNAQPPQQPPGQGGWPPGLPGGITPGAPLPGFPNRPGSSDVAPTPGAPTPAGQPTAATGGQTAQIAGMAAGGAAGALAPPALAPLASAAATMGANALLGGPNSTNSPAGGTQPASGNRASPPAAAPAGDLGSLRRYFASLDCSALAATMAPEGRMLVQGVVGKPADREAAQAAAQTLVARNALNFDVSVLPPPPCQGIAPMTPFFDRNLAGGNLLSIKVRTVDRSLRAGDPLVVEVQGGSEPGRLLIMYFNSAGQAVRVAPTLDEPDDLLRPRQKRVISSIASDDGSGFQIGTPPGEEVVAVIVSPEPLQRLTALSQISTTAAFVAEFRRSVEPDRPKTLAAMSLFTAQPAASTKR